MFLTIFPFPGGRVDIAKQFIVCDGLGVKILPNWLSLHVYVCLVQRAKDLGLTYRE